jgi:hypothetical protein
VAIREIERLTKLDFGDLNAIDPQATVPEAFGAQQKPLQSLRQVRFV